MFYQKLMFHRWIVQVGMQIGINWALSIEAIPFSLFEIKLFIVRFGIHTIDMKPYTHTLKRVAKAKKRKHSHKRIGVK